MVQLRTRRAALALYGVLLVLPTVVLGGLQWYEITEEFEEEVARLPSRAIALAERVKGVLADDLAALLEAEDAREFDIYASYSVVPQPDETRALLRTPLHTEPPPEGILAWFVFEHRIASGLKDGNPRLFWSDDFPHTERERLEHGLETALIDIHFAEDGRLEFVETTDTAPVVTRTAAHLGAMNALSQNQLRCLGNNLDYLHSIPINFHIGEYKLKFYREGDGIPRLFAMRIVTGETLRRFHPPCLESLVTATILVQGFFIDPEWYFDRLPRAVVSQMLDETQHFVAIGDSQCCPGKDANHAPIRLIEDFSIETRDSTDDTGFGTIQVAVDASAAERRVSNQRFRFLGLAAMLMLSLSIGMLLLLRSVNRDLEQARQTENFVASVTHELRTPLSGIKLHAEMLLDGWASEAEQQAEYHRRIVRDTDRLSTLVERVLEKSRLDSKPVRAVPADLNRLIQEVAVELKDDSEYEGRDLAFELADDVPEVLVTNEAVRSILVNLVENARKYAPVPMDAKGQPTGEAILVRTKAHSTGALLEVSDRGPGIAPKEADRVFQAFYRIGNEKTRTSRGTGLGLHLVARQAAAIGGSARVEPRPGGGSTFRVRFARA